MEVFGRFYGSARIDAARAGRSAVSRRQHEFAIRRRVSRFISFRELLVGLIISGL